MVRRAHRGGNCVSIVRGFRGKEQVKYVRRLVMAIWNTCRMLYNLFQIIKKGKTVGFDSPRCSPGRTEPPRMVCIEVAQIDDFGVVVVS